MKSPRTWLMTGNRVARAASVVKGAWPTTSFAVMNDDSISAGDTEALVPGGLDEARAALKLQKARIVVLAKAKNFEALPSEHMRLRQLERLVQSLANARQ